MKKTILLVVTGVIIIVISCSKTNEEQLKETVGTPVCDTVNKQYAADVLPVIQANCYSCHGNGNLEGGINLDGYDNLKAKADDGELIGAITHAPGFIPMPLDKAKLSDCDINTIQSWINNGALNN